MDATTLPSPARGNGPPLRLVTDAAALIRIRSANPPGGERAVAEWLAARLEPVADEVRVEPVADGRANLVATFDFGPGPTFVLCSHSDVVPPQDDEQWDPVVRDGRLIGRGACDAKGAIAAMIAASERLAQNRAGLRGRLLLACVADEETNAAGVLALVAGGLRADAAIIGEPTDNVVALSSRGVLRMGVRFHGRAAHASSPARGANTLYAAARFILAIESLNAELDARASTGSCAATIVEGGSKLNIVPDACVVQIDRRLGLAETSAMAVWEIETRLESVVREVPGVSCDWSRSGLWVDPFDLVDASGFGPLLLSAVGQAAPGPSFQAVSDAPHLIRAGIPTAILGPGSLDVAHSRTEFVRVRDLEHAAYLYERIARAYLG